MFSGTITSGIAKKFEPSKTTVVEKPPVREKDAVPLIVPDTGDKVAIDVPSLRNVANQGNCIPGKLATPAKFTAIGELLFRSTNPP